MAPADIQRHPFQSYLSFIFRHPSWALVMTGLITLALGWYLPRLSFKTTVYDLIIQDLPEARRYQQFRQMFGSDEIIQLVVKAGDIFDPATFAKVSQLSAAAAQIPGVRRILSLPEVKRSVESGGAWDLSKFAAMLAPVKLFQRNLLSADHKTTIITLVLDSQADKEAVLAATRRLIAESGPDLQIYQTGMPLVSEALAQYTRQDVMHLTPVTLLVIALLLAILLRNLHSLILPLVCVSVSGVWTFGLMALTGVAVSMLTIIIPVLLIAVGTAYCLHICSEYLAQSRTMAAAADACRETYSRLALPTTLAVLTTILGIGSLAANDITAIREFAFFASFGMLSLLVIVMTFLPAMFAILPLPAKRARASSAVDRFFDRLLNGVVVLNLKYRKITLSVIGAISVVCAAGVLLVRVETNPVAFFKKSTPVRRHFRDIYRDMAGSFPINVAMSAKLENYFEDPANVAAIAQLQEFLDQLPGVDKSISFADYIKLVSYVYNGYDPKYYALPEDGYELRMLTNNFKILLGNDFLQRFMSPDSSQVNILMLTHIASSRQFLNTQTAIAAYARNHLPQEVQLEVTGLGMVIAASSHLLTVGQVKSLSISLVLIFGVMVALFVSSKVGLIAVVPNLFPILVNFGLMGLLGIPLSVATSLIASVAIGLAVDDTIHYLVRYNTEFKRDLDKDRAMGDTLRSVGRPMIFTSCTISLGFAVLIFSHFQPTAIFGFLMVVTMISALIGDILLLPALMMHVELVTAWDLLKMIPMVGGISPGLVHELNQPLNAIKVGSDFLKLMLRQGAPIQEKHLSTVTQEISDQVARASQIIQRLSSAGRLPGFEKEKLQIKEPIVETLAIVENQLKLDNIRLTLELAENLPPIVGHHNRLMQVIYNLIDNSRDAIAAQRSREDHEKPHAITIRGFEARQGVAVTVTDSGNGIADHYLDRIFEPFFTTKASGKGKGLGLSISQQIMRDCGGRIRVSSRPGQGTTVTLWFPRADAQVALEK